MSTDPKVAVVDFSKEDCFRPGTSCWLSARKDVCNALEDLGCFMAVLPPTEVAPQLRNTIFGSLSELFDFPGEIKSQTPKQPPLVDGYYRASTAAHESFCLVANTDSTRKFTAQFWPKGNDQFRESIDQFTKVMEELNLAVTRMIFENYDVEKYYEDHSQTIISSLRFTKYKEPKKPGNDELGLPSHTDKTFLTLLHQNHVNGLEIYNAKGDKWMLADLLPSTVIVFAGEGLQVWSNDRVQACLHRVTLRENEVRFSLSRSFLQNAVVRVPEELTDEDHPLQYKPHHMMEWLEYFQANKYTLGFDYPVKNYLGV